MGYRKFGSTDNTSPNTSSQKGKDRIFHVRLDESRVGDTHSFAVRNMIDLIIQQLLNWYKLRIDFFFRVKIETIYHQNNPLRFNGKDDSFVFNSRSY